MANTNLANAKTAKNDEFNIIPTLSVTRWSSYHAMILNGATLLVSLRRILSDWG